MSCKEALQRAAAIAREQVNQVAAESIERIRENNLNRNRERYGCRNCDLSECYKTCPRYLTHAEPEMLFAWWGRTSPPDRRVCEVLPPGEPSKKGGSKSGKKRKNKKITEFRYWAIG